MRQLIYMLIGSYVGSYFVRPIGSIFGALVGFYIARKQYEREMLRNARAKATIKRKSEYARDYAILHISPTASNYEIIKAYRNEAKRLHPDLLKARGASEKEIREATTKMAELNSAWERIKNIRGI